MSPDSYIRLNNIWKRFRRGEIHDSLRDLIPALIRRAAPKPREPGYLEENEFWALQDLNFEVLPGQTLGIIGGNGAGKSTALKVLTRILRPTHGSVEVKGRIGSLIEIQAGFHQDLTGRENIFLQGAIMGMPQELIRRKFDEIVEFSGISEFLDTPVKRYSSGMNARLGFSIAAHLDPEVLIIDEVLAVGDFRFQEKAFGRIRTLATSGIPVVIVSHQLDRIASLCTDAIVLDRGRVAYRGAPGDAIAWYLSGNRLTVEGESQPHAVTVSRLSIEGPKDVAAGERIRLVMEGQVSGEAVNEKIALRIRAAANGQVVSGIMTDRCGVVLENQGPFRLAVRLQMNVRPGVYAVEPWVVDRTSGKDLAIGPIAYVQVEDDSEFIGSVYLRPEIEPQTRAASTDSAGQGAGTPRLRAI
jgi:ABC-type polysaccharide/polyol phosphate transport system ATPase subunit